MYAREYELIYIVSPEVAEDEVTTVRERTERVITERNGTILRVEDWGVKRLAYDIQKHSKGRYVLFCFLGDREVVAEAERTLRIDDKVLRFLTVKIAERVDIEARVALEAVRKAEEALAIQVDPVVDRGRDRDRDRDRDQDLDDDDRGLMLD